MSDDSAVLSFIQCHELNSIILDDSAVCDLPSNAHLDFTYLEA
jgi:hypothetical protein